MNCAPGWLLETRPQTPAPGAPRPRLLVPPVPSCAVGALTTDRFHVAPSQSRPAPPPHSSLSRTGQVGGTHALTASAAGCLDTGAGPQGGMAGTTARQAWPAPLGWLSQGQPEHEGLGRPQTAKALSPRRSKPSWSREARSPASQSQHGNQACHGGAWGESAASRDLSGRLPWALASTDPPHGACSPRRWGSIHITGSCSEVRPSQHHYFCTKCPVITVCC